MALERSIVTYGFGELPSGGGGGGPIDPCTLAVADLANGTGATATITLSDNGSVTNEVYVGLWTGESSLNFEVEGTRTGNGTVSLTLAVGNYFAYVLSEDDDAYAVSNFVFFRVTNSSSIPVVERIARSMKRRLDQVTTGNGYTLTLSPIRPPRRGIGTAPHGRCIVEQAPEAQKVGQVDGNPAAIEWRQEFYVTIFVAADDDDTTPVDQIANYAAADAEKAITTEQLSGDWAQFDNLALESEQTARDIQFDGETATIRLAYAVTYRHSENDPYTVR